MISINKKRLTRDEAERLHQTVTEMYAEKLSYFVMVVLAATVASLGLLTNSTAVIIGAMLISPIMGPILGISFSIATGISKMMARSFGTLALGVLLALVVSIFFTYSSPNPELTSEILARTRPQISDLLIAIASGAAGAYALCVASGITAFAGVAIATALMPPLCVVGIGIALGDNQVAFGGALLFATNLIGINLAAAMVFWILGISSSRAGISGEQDSLAAEKKRKKRLGLSIVATILVAIPLAAIMTFSVLQQQEDEAVQGALTTYLSSYRYVELVEYEYTKTTDGYEIHTVVRSEDSFDGADIEKMQNYVGKKLGKPTTVTMELVIAYTVDQNTVRTP